MTFNVGDKVTVPDTTGDDVREVLYGPYISFEGSGKRYLVSKAGGFATAVYEVNMVPAPKFKVGDKARSLMHGEDVEIVYGPYLAWDGNQHVLTKNDKGEHRHPRLGDIIPIAKPTVGDRVRVVKDTRSGTENYYVGKIGTVVEFDKYDSALPWKVKLDDNFGNTWVYEIEKI